MGLNLCMPARGPTGMARGPTGMARGPTGVARGPMGMVQTLSSGGDIMSLTWNL